MGFCELYFLSGPLRYSFTTLIHNSPKNKLICFQSFWEAFGRFGRYFGEVSVSALGSSCVDLGTFLVRLLEGVWKLKPYYNPTQRKRNLLKATVDGKQIPLRSVAITRHHGVRELP